MESNQPETQAITLTIYIVLLGEKICHVHILDPPPSHSSLGKL